MNESVKERLDRLLATKATLDNLAAFADPLQVARAYKDHEFAPEIALICALFAYGNARLIVRFLNSLDFSLLSASETKIYLACKDLKYRFQTSEDVAQIFITFNRLLKTSNLKTLVAHFRTQAKVQLFDKPAPEAIGVIWGLINHLYSLNSYRSKGYEFYFAKVNQTCALKRYAMWLRWMSRKDQIDMGLIDFPTSELLLPLDTHTHKMSLQLGFSKRKQANLRTAIEATEALRRFDENDPIKYDFALYRISQQGE